MLFYLIIYMIILIAIFYVSSQTCTTFHCLLSSSPGRVNNFHFSISSRPALRSTQLPIQWVPRAFPSGIKRPVRESHHSHPSSAEVKKKLI
jgi:hypothetical protein